MALYEYKCRLNGHRFEVRHGMNERPVQTCLECSGEVRRVITAPGIVFKGSGFYVTDSRKASETVSDSKPPPEGRESHPKTVCAKTVARDTSGDAKAAS